jgi:hypothetical protein
LVAERAIKGERSIFDESSCSNICHPFAGGSGNVGRVVRYQYHDEYGGELEYIFDTDEQTVPNTVTEAKAAEIAMDWMRVFYGVEVGTMESEELKATPVPYWLFCFTDTAERMFFVVILPDGTVVEPRVAKRV